MPPLPEPSDDDLIEFAESLLQNLAPRLREREVLEEAIRQHRDTWVTLYEAAADLKRAKPPQ